MCNEVDAILTLNRHPFDTIKVRLQTSKHSQFKGPLDCLLQTLRKEGVNGIYKVNAKLRLEETCGSLLPGCYASADRMDVHG